MQNGFCALHARRHVITLVSITYPRQARDHMQIERAQGASNGPSLHQITLHDSLAPETAQKATQNLATTSYD